MPQTLNSLIRSVLGRPINQAVEEIKRETNGTGARVLGTSDGNVHIVVPVDKKNPEAMKEPAGTILPGEGNPN